MLSIQREPFDQAKGDDTLYPRDFARWNTLDYFRHPRRFRACRFWITLGATVLAMLLSLATVVYSKMHWTHQAAPVSKAHAMFNDNCANCHDRAWQPVARLFGSANAASVSDQKCIECHVAPPHVGAAEHGVACTVCHHEHQGHATLAPQVADRFLTPRLTYGGTKFTITKFERDHPEFQPGLGKDPSRIRFNHQAHLDLDIDALKRANQAAGRADLAQFTGKMQCADCHQQDSQRGYMAPIQYDRHCASCHHLNVALTGKFDDSLKGAVAKFSAVPLPHREPAVVRAVMRDRLVEFARANQVIPGTSQSLVVRKLPWSLTERDSVWVWATGEAKKEEGLVFLRFLEKQWDDGRQRDEPKKWTRESPPMLTWCSHCHIEKDRSADGLPTYHETRIPQRWYPKSEFNHGSHRMVRCEECHDRNAARNPVRTSDSAEHVLLPTVDSCKQCHHETGGARSACAECHRYHDRAGERGLDGKWKLQDIVDLSR